MNLQRLDKIIATQLNIPRSLARKHIRWGKVSVNGKILRDPSLQISSDSEIEYKGETVVYREHIYIVMNKPKGVLSASNDKTRKTVVDLVAEPLKRSGLAPVGRLDKDTTGLLILTDDGEFAHNVISPKKNIIKTYEVLLDGDVTEKMISEFREGIVLADGTKCRSAELKRMDENKAEIKISEGKYHQIKRMFGTVGLGVNELKRTALGGFGLPKELKEGESRELREDEISAIFKNC